MSIYRKPSKWKAGHFPAERILSIALHQKEFSIHLYQYRDDNKRKKAKRMAKEGLLKHMGVVDKYRYYTITDAGKARLKELQEKGANQCTN